MDDDGARDGRRKEGIVDDEKRNCSRRHWPAAAKTKQETATRTREQKLGPSRRSGSLFSARIAGRGNFLVVRGRIKGIALESERRE